MEYKLEKIIMDIAQQLNLKNIVYGTALGDAFGVPWEFMTRKEIAPLITREMTGHGTHNQSPGTWSDDTALTLCLVNALPRNCDTKIIAHNILHWYDYGTFAIDHNTYDVGGATAVAVENIRRGLKPEECGPADERSNGNGALMRIAPLAVYVMGKDDDERQAIVFSITSITHGHIRNAIACWIFIEYLIKLLQKIDRYDALDQVVSLVKNWVRSSSSPGEWNHFQRIGSHIRTIPEVAIRSTGYVIDTLEAALWSFLTTENFEEAILKGVRLGDDTDTVAAVTGALAGAYYGSDFFPPDWLTILRGKEIIEEQLMTAGTAIR